MSHPSFQLHFKLRNRLAGNHWVPHEEDVAPAIGKHEEICLIHIPGAIEDRDRELVAILDLVVIVALVDDLPVDLIDVCRCGYRACRRDDRKGRHQEHEVASRACVHCALKRSR